MLHQRLLSTQSVSNMGQLARKLMISFVQTFYPGQNRYCLTFSEEITPFATALSLESSALYAVIYARV